MTDWLRCEFSDDDITVIEPPHAERSSQLAVRKRRRIQKPSMAHEESLPYLDDGLWLNKYKPRSVSQLAGNKAKIGQLSEWIRETTSQAQVGRILLLTGPSGCGKTAAVEAIAAEANISIKQWTSQTADFIPLEQRGDNSLNYNSQTALFDGFLLRAAKYSALPLLGDAACTRQMVLVEDIPNVYLISPAEWHNKLRSYSRSARSLLTIIYNTSGSVMERTMFPESVQSELNIKHISFNAVPKTDIKRLLTNISDNEPQMAVPKDAIAYLSESCDGDIRTAVNSLQFKFALSQDLSQPEQKSKGVRSSSTAVKRKTKTATAAIVKSSQGRDLTDQVYKDPTLVIFRALGKILHCKRLDTRPDSELSLPAHLRHHVRCEMAFNPEQTFEQAQVSADYYTLCLQQNYPLFLSNVENAERAVDYLSQSDCLSQQFSGRFVTSQATAAVSTAARGMMHANTVVSTTHKLGWVPLHKPQWFSASKQLKEHQINIKWHNNSLCSSAAAALDLVPALHLMKAKTTLTKLIPSLTLTTHQSGRQERLDDRYGRADINIDLTSELPSHTTIGPEEDNSVEMKDDPDEYHIESCD